MNDGIKGMEDKDGFQDEQLCVARQVTVHDFDHVLPFWANDGQNVANDALARIGEIVNQDNLVICLDKGNSHVTSDESSSTGEQNRLHFSPFSRSQKERKGRKRSSLENILFMVECLKFLLASHLLLSRLIAYMHIDESSGEQLPPFRPQQQTMPMTQIQEEELPLRAPGRVGSEREVSDYLNRFEEIRKENRKAEKKRAKAERKRLRELEPVPR